MRFLVLGTDKRQISCFAYALATVSDHQPILWHVVSSFTPTRDFWQHYPFVKRTLTPADAEKQIGTPLPPNEGWIFDQVNTGKLLQNPNTGMVIQTCANVIFTTTAWSEQIASNMHSSFQCIYIQKVTTTAKQQSLHPYLFSHLPEVSNESLLSTLAQLKPLQVLAYYPNGKEIVSSSSNETPDDKKSENVQLFEMIDYQEPPPAPAPMPTSLIGSISSTAAVGAKAPAISAISATSSAIGAHAPTSAAAAVSGVNASASASGLPMSLSFNSLSSNTSSAKSSSPPSVSVNPYVSVEMIVDAKLASQTAATSEALQQFWIRAIKSSPEIQKFISDVKFQKKQLADQTTHYYLACQVDGNQDVFIGAWLLLHVKRLKQQGTIVNGGIFV